MKGKTNGTLRTMTALAAGLLAAGLLTACQPNSNDTPAQSSGGDTPREQDAQEQDAREPDASQAELERGATAEIRERGKVRIAVFADKPPFGYLDETGANAGFDIVIAKRVAKDLLGDENAVEWAHVEPANRVDYLESDKVDLVFANFTVTPERSERVDFALPYMKVALGVVSPEAAPINDVSDLEGEQLIVIKGTTAETYFTNEYPEIELLKFDEISEAFQALTDGRGAGLAQDNTFLFAWANENPGYAVGVGSLGNQDVIAPAVRKGNAELLEWLNEELRALGEERFIHQAYDEALAPIYGDVVNPEDLVVEGGEL
ncbi:MAG: transporter substrate-binding domain-containing protein [Clostridiales bacterium]|jgi:polar amino acid transport system substrate-binding protein|nr:transporter substrate-binding domain-containing protein [Clostridiales bacterium]